MMAKKIKEADTEEEVKMAVVNLMMLYKLRYRYFNFFIVIVSLLECT